MQHSSRRRYCTEVRTYSGLLVWGTLGGTRGPFLGLVSDSDVGTVFGRGQSTPSRFSAGVNTSYLEHKDRCPTRLPAHVPRQSSPNLARHARITSDDRKATGCLTQTDTPLYVYPSRQRTVIPMPIRSARGVMGTASGVSMYLARIMTCHTSAPDRTPPRVPALMVSGQCRPGIGG